MKNYNLDKLIEVLLEAKEKYGGETNIRLNDSDNWQTNLEEIFYYDNEIILGVWGACNWTSADFYHRL